MRVCVRRHRCAAGDVVNPVARRGMCARVARVTTLGLYRQTWDAMKHVYAPGIAILAVAALVVLPIRAAKAQCPVTAERLAKLKDASRAYAGTEMQAAPVVVELDGDPTVSSPAGASSADDVVRGGAVDLYIGLQPGPWQTWRRLGGGGGELTYWALDDGKIGPGAAAIVMGRTLLRRGVKPQSPAAHRSRPAAAWAEIA